MFRSNIIRVLLIGACLIPLPCSAAAANDANCKVTGSPKNVLTTVETDALLAEYFKVRNTQINIVLNNTQKVHYLNLMAGELEMNIINLTQLPSLRKALKKHKKQSNNRQFALELVNNTIKALTPNG